MSERVAARELEIQYAFAVAVLQALRTVVREMEPVDPHFDEIRDARTEPPATEE